MMKLPSRPRSFPASETPIGAPTDTPTAAPTWAAVFRDWSSPDDEPSVE